MTKFALYDVVTQKGITSDLHRQAGAVHQSSSVWKWPDVSSCFRNIRVSVLRVIAESNPA